MKKDIIFDSWPLRLSLFTVSNESDLVVSNESDLVVPLVMWKRGLKGADEVTRTFQNAYLPV